MYNLKKNEKGVTLIALMVTIIILIILAGVSISALTNNGILNKVQETKAIAEIQNFKERVSLAQISLETEITTKVVTEPGYIATSSENFEELVENVAKEFDIYPEDVVSQSKMQEYKIASTEPVINSSPNVVNTEGYTISASLDIIGNNNTEGHGYITIWYTSNALRSNLSKSKSLTQYEIANIDEENNIYGNETVLISILHVKNNCSEYVAFDLDNENTTGYGLTTIGNATSNMGKKLKDTNYAVSTKEYSILTLNSNNELNEKKQEYMKVGNSYIVPNNSYSREGYTFTKWNTLSDGTGSNFNPGDIITDTNHNVDLYAIWEPIEYSISYELNGGTATNPTKYTIESNDITLNKPVKDQYYFTGWTGSNGDTPQEELVISKGSTGNKTYNANYAQYTQAALRTFNESDSNVSWSFNTATGVYTITQKAGSSGWGVGVVCDDSKTDINWDKNYMLEFEIKVPNTYTLKTDGNTMFSSDGSGNDIYGTSWLIVDGNRTDGNGFGRLPQSTEISGGTWHKVQMYLINNNTNDNTGHKAIRSYSGFGLNLTSVSSNVTYEMKNLKSIVY